MAAHQDYCDWCYGSVDSEDRRRSDEAGTDLGSAWACVNCIETGRVFEAPEWWEGDPADWPVKDIRDQVKLAERNLAVVLADVHRTSDSRPELAVDTYRSMVRIAYRGGSVTPSVTATSNPEALVEIAEYLKELVVEEEGWSPWPVCPVHDIGGVHPEAVDGLAVWWCHFGAHLVAEVGKLRRS